MKALGHNEYYTVFRHLILYPGEQREEKGYNELYFLLEDSAALRIESDFGVYDQTAKFINEVSYEHHGLVVITNLDIENNTSVKFIQAIPKHKTED